jgi:hypothetical protein
MASFNDIPTRYFENSWKILGNMVVYLEPKGGMKNASENAGVF